MLNSSLDSWLNRSNSRLNHSWLILVCSWMLLLHAAGRRRPSGSMVMMSRSAPAMAAPAYKETRNDLLLVPLSAPVFLPGICKIHKGRQYNPVRNSIVLGP